MRLSAVQFKGTRGDKAGSLRRLVALASAAAQKADLVVLPEMAATRYVFGDKAEIRPVSEPARGETFGALAPIAKAHRCWLVAGFAECEADRFFNSALIIDPRGELAFTYRKTLLYHLDLPWATPGDSGYKRFDADWGSFTPGICMDLNDDRFTAWCQDCGADVVAFPTNWVEQFDRVWSYWRRRLHPEATLVAANTYGLDRRTWFSGRSVVMHRGQPLASGAWLGDGVIRAEVTPTSP